MEIFKDSKAIGYSNYFFDHKKNSMEVKNYTQFKVKLFGVIVFSVSSEAHEIYKNDNNKSTDPNWKQNARMVI